MRTNSRGEFNPTLVIFFTVLLLLISTVGIFMYKTQLEKKYTDMPIQNTKPTIIDEGGMYVPTPPSKPTAEETNSPTPAPSQKKPVVVYIPSGNFSPNEITELEMKLVNPMVDWNIEQNRPAVSLSIEKYAEPVAGYAYKVNYINEDGTNGGLLFGTTTPLEWWLPECINGCNLSPEFAAKYPEIAKHVE